MKRDAKAAKNKKRYFLAAYLRWMFIVPIILLSFAEGFNTVEPILFYIAFAVLIVYLAVIALFLQKIYSESNRIRYVILFMDALVLSCFTYILGGIQYDIYMVFLFLTGYCALTCSFSSAVRAGIFSAFAYSAAVIVAFKGSPGEFPVITLVLRNSLFIFTAVGIAVMRARESKRDNANTLDSLLARTDKLTGLYNRHYLEQKLEEEKNHADVSGKPLNIMMFDLDDFKLFNDTHGHPRGDKLLSLFADIINSNTRKSDVPVRYGGEEFLVIVRDLDIDKVKGIGERIRNQLEKQRIYIVEDDEKKKVTVSCGIAQYPTDAGNIKRVIELADKALYSVKESGKNAVCSYRDMDTQKQVR